MQDFAWLRATSATEAAAVADQTTAEAMVTPTGRLGPAEATLIKAGGVDLLDLMKDGLVSPRQLVDISRLRELEGITVDDGGGVRIGALTTLARIVDHPDLRRSHPALGQAAAEAASPQIRNRATLGGNLLQRPRCWYLRSSAHHCLRKGGTQCFALEGDNRYHAVFANRGCAIVHASTPATPLVAYRAEMQLLSADGRRRQVPLEDFLLLPETDPHRENGLMAGEILTGVTLPPQPQTSNSFYLEVGERAAFDWPLAAAAAVLNIDTDGQCRQASLVLGAAAPVPWRAKRAEALLVGTEINGELAAAAAQAALAGATPLSGNTYKLALLATLVRRAILAAAGLSQSTSAAVT